MEIQNIKDIFASLGDYSSQATQKVISYLSGIGVGISQTQSKLLNLLIIFVFLFVLIKFIEIPKKIIKYSIIIILLVLGISTIVSLF